MEAVVKSVFQILMFAWITAGASPVLAEGTLDSIWGKFEDSVGLSEPPERLERGVGDFRDEITSLGSKIDNTIEILKDVNAYGLSDAEAEAQVVREEIEEIITRVVDGGDLDETARENLEWMYEQKKRMQQRQDLSATNKQRFSAAWDNYISEARRIQEDLFTVRNRLNKNLIALKNTEAILEELLVLGKAGDANAAIQEIITDFHDVIRYIESLDLEYTAPNTS